MDTNKLKVLQGLPYKIHSVCGLCQNGFFPNNDWGTCKVTTYKHEKHSVESSQLSIHKYGSCPKFESRKDLFVVLGSFQEFLK